MSDSHASTRVSPGTRTLTYVAFAFVVIVYLAIIQLGGLLVNSASGEDSITSVRGVVFTLIVPLGVALLFTFAVITYLGWWRPVMTDDRPVRKWLWVIPAVFVVAILLGIDYSALGSKGIWFIVLLLFATQLVGWGEEAMFRGVGVTVLRQHGLTEGRVALWSSLIFGAVHLTNAIGHGVSAVPQAVAVSLAGYFFYLIRRVSGSNALNSVIHGLFDFSLLTAAAIVVGQSGYVGSFAAIALYPILAIVLLLNRRRIEKPAS
ncbi:CPBP family intramembrane glutamic endopeptidase [Rhodococcoides yunnanense]|uniref:CPBP family intramembrane glutamic endopeptidase n=1 Tax=Rhodococcoides yunnanense TaxID=278209 RepID=UPI0009342AFB|nr:CPBP family intramembrane glutamic endopeptidase [Rhodococcus yunnanensis]